MTIISEDGEMGVDFGGYEFWQSLFSTIMKLYVNDKKAIPQTTDFFKKIKCKKGKINELLLELSDIRNRLISEPIPVRGSGNYESDEAKEIARLKRELRDAQDALDVLKKAISILGKD